MKQNCINKLGPLLIAGVVLTTSVLFGSNTIAEEKTADAGRGAKAWAENCTRCHNVRDPRELRDDQWKTTTYHMRVRAGLTGQQTRDIIKFLQESN